MLREVPSFVIHNEPTDNMDAPTMPHEHHEEPQHTNDLFEDIFGSAPNSPQLGGIPGDDIVAGRGNTDEVSDIPRLRSRHVTEGYREGVAESKEKFIQAGFDEGYSLGAEIGLKAGWCLGVLEGVCKALEKTQAGDSKASGQQDNVEAEELFKKAKEELQMQKLYDPAYFGSDGIWLYDVPGSEAETTFRDVASAHPVLSPWLTTTRAAADRVGLAFA